MIRTNRALHRPWHGQQAANASGVGGLCGAQQRIFEQGLAQTCASDPGGWGSPQELPTTRRNLRDQTRKSPN